jgi:hypothetical protein
VEPEQGNFLASGTKSLFCAIALLHIQDSFLALNSYFSWTRFHTFRLLNETNSRCFSLNDEGDRVGQSSDVDIARAKSGGTTRTLVSTNVIQNCNKKIRSGEFFDSDIDCNELNTYRIVPVLNLSIAD